MATLNTAQILNGTKLGSADKKALTSLFNGLINDIETLRAKNVALCQKLDTAGGSVAGLGTNYNSTVGVPVASLQVGK